jgi:hypothetical protein
MQAKGLLAFPLSRLERLARSDAHAAGVTASGGKQMRGDCRLLVFGPKLGHLTTRQRGSDPGAGRHPIGCVLCPLRAGIFAFGSSEFNSAKKKGSYQLSRFDGSAALMGSKARSQYQLQ